MEKILGLEQEQGFGGKDRLLDFCLENLKTALFRIFEIDSEGNRFLLAELELVDQGINYKPSEQIIDLFFQGILINKGLPTCYHVCGNTLMFIGQCSVFCNVCGTDLLLDKHSFESPGSLIYQKYTINLKKVLKSVPV